MSHPPRARSRRSSTLLVPLAVLAIAAAGACSASDSGSAPSSGRGDGTADGGTGMPVGAGGSGAYGGGSGTGSGGGAGGSGGNGGFGFDAGVGIGGGAGATGGPSGAAGAGASAGAAGAPEDAGALDAGDADACAALDSSKPAVYFLSADDSNSMASPVIARRYIELGGTVPKWIVRTYEFLNYYNVGYAPAKPDTLGIVPEMAPAADAGSYEMQIGVASPPAASPRRPVNFTFVLDTSGSMGGSPIALERAAVLAIAGSLRSGDIVSAVEWNTTNAVQLDSHIVSGPNDPALVSLASGLVSGGGTNLNGGLTAGYAVAKKNYKPDILNRVILISDGQANAGVTDKDIIAQGAALNDGDGIYLMGVGVGDGVNDTLMNTVTDAGRGAYVYLDSAAEAQRMFGPRFAEVTDIAARAVQVELHMPWYMAIQRFSGEQYSHDPTKVEPQHLAPDDAMVFNQVIGACAADHVDGADPVEVIARWQTPVTHLLRQASVATTVGALLGATPKYLPKGDAIVAYAEALKLDGSAAHAKLTEAKALAEAADPAGTDPELTEIRTLIDKALVIYQ